MSYVSSTSRFQAPTSSRSGYREAIPQRDGSVDIMARLQGVVAAAKRVADAVACIMSEDYLRRKRNRPYSEEAKRKGWVRQLLTVVLALQLLWVYVLYWGERTVYSSAIEACDWRYWEQWPNGANPHHIALVADPQLVDPHTYPGRPWPLSTLTVLYTDLYLKRVYTLMQSHLYPDTTIFLGDLFDGGREWSVSGGSRWENPTKSWRKYGEQFWLNEYNRFGKIFFDTFTRIGVEPRQGQTERRQLIASLPGNHDLGFGNGVHLPVRQRFEAYFGEGNRVDIIGNHSFISVDGVSLSAKDHEGEGTEEIWHPTARWLEKVEERRVEAIAKDLKKQFGEEFRKRLAHEVYDWPKLEKAKLPKIDYLDSSGYPAVLLSHVPLYRDPETPCGPLREKNPQGRDEKGRLLEKDPHNSILVQAGYQYQNVLSGEVTLEITSQIGDVRYAFSGDDHDYCEVKHMRFPSGGGGIREVTVKSLSWAMGVRRPGFQLVTLWNPIDEEGLRIEGPIDTPTLKSHLCLLPDQLAIFIRYALVFGLTLTVLGLRAAHISQNPAKSPFSGPDTPVLPTSAELKHVSQRFAESEEAQTSSSDDGYPASGRRSRAGTLTRNRSSSSASPAKSPFNHPSSGSNKFGVPLVQHAGYFGSTSAPRDEEKKSFLPLSKAGVVSVVNLKGVKLFWAELRWTILRVVFIALPWYLWLLWVDPV